MMVMSDRKIQSLASQYKTISFKIKKHEAFHSLIVAVIFRAGY